jgi:hypothetical protein
LGGTPTRIRELTRNTVYLGLLLTFGGAGSLAAQTVTAFKTGEVTTGLTKQCFYNAAGSSYSQTVRAVDLCPLNIQVRLSNPSGAAPQTVAPSLGLVGFKTGEVTTGLTKQCFYNAAGSTYTLTVRAIDLCPLNVRVR